MGGGRFSLLYKKLVAGLSLFTDIEAFTTDHINDGLFVIGGKLQKGVALEHANEEVDRVINNLLAGNYSGHGWLEAAKGQEVGDFAIGAAQLSQRVESYAWGVLLGTPHFFYEEIKGVEGASEKRVLRAAKRLFHRGEKRLYYHARS